jgi:hypothetical protein
MVNEISTLPVSEGSTRNVPTLTLSRIEPMSPPSKVWCRITSVSAQAMLIENASSRQIEAAFAVII